jgi:hypothetical protein
LWPSTSSPFGDSEGGGFTPDPDTPDYFHFFQTRQNCDSPAMTSAQRTQANGLAARLDTYNNGGSAELIGSG